MGSMQGPGPAQGQAVDENEASDPKPNDARYDELNRKVENGEELSTEEQDELNKLNEEGANKGAQKIDQQGKSADADGTESSVEGV